jgi:hypothetical protein
VSLHPIPPFLAAIAANGAVSPWYKLSAGVREQIVLVSALTLVTLFIVVWALLFRKRRRRRSHRSSPTLARSAIASNVQRHGDPSPKRRKWRRRRGEERPRNPTLAETRGLPRLRSEGSSEAQL